MLGCRSGRGFLYVPLNRSQVLLMTATKNLRLGMGLGERGIIIILYRLTTFCLTYLTLFLSLKCNHLHQEGVKGNVYLHPVVGLFLNYPNVPEQYRNQIMKIEALLDTPIKVPLSYNDLVYYI